jgi:hypothetical protein
MPFVPDTVADESAGAVKVIEGAAVSTFVVPSAFFAVMVVLGGIDAVTVARYPVAPEVPTVVAVAPVVALPFELTVAVKEVVAEGFVTTGVPSSPPPHPPTIIKTPNIAAMPNIFNNLLIPDSSFVMML